jgi:hypothetical protein
LEALRASSEPLVVPIMTMTVVRHRMPAADRNFEQTGVDFQSYFVTPEGSRAGEAGEKLSFSQAVNRMIF